ncbi:spore germination protein [Peribacillus glennii]|uniref:Spore germination protein n=1 Tax=Peribacillus glennii TaxID=2303991 RepID=A0A372LHX7_9BACI|nr:spore germination protein [Peribacillus glennii]RFU65594.1 spore germination protein [Peribacillus glennii]
MASETKKTMKPIPDNVTDVETYMKERVGLGVSFDIGVRKLKVQRKDIHVYYVTGLVDSSVLVPVIKNVIALNNADSTMKVYELVKDRIVHQQVKEVHTMDEMADQVLSGLIGIVIDGTPKALIVDVRSYPGRAPQEPDTEKTIRGARDGYTENIIVNTALTRRRIRDERLRFEIMKVGERSKADVAIGYIENIADPDLVNIIRRELKSIKIDGITMAEKTLEEFIVKQGYNPFPLVRYTERADVAATHLLEGHVIIIADTSPSVMITPTTIFHHMQHAEEYRQSPAVGTMIRWVRFLGILASLLLVPFWLLFAMDPSLLPDSLSYIGPKKETSIPTVVQIFIADFGMEFLRMAAIHTPTPLSTAMGLIAAILIGEIAINVGLFVPEVILYVAVATIGTYATPSLELSIANKMARLFLLILTAFFHAPGLVIGITVFILYLASIKSMKTPYLWPLLPFYPRAFAQILFRRPVPGSGIRPSVVHPMDRYRQPE